MENFKREELSAAKYELDGYELRQVKESGSWAMFRSYEDEGARIYYVVDDDWGAGNVDDESLFSYRVGMQQEELAYLMASL